MLDLSWNSRYFCGIVSPGLGDAIVRQKLTFAAFDRWRDAGDIMALSVFDLTLVLLWSFLGIAISEGLPDFFETSTAEFEQENIAALERIGAGEAAHVMRAAYPGAGEGPRVT